jgi:ubiquitin carboxyl-terminal hydrolase 7
MVFLKHFDTSKQTLRGIGKCYAQRTAKVQDLVPTINERMRWTPGTPLKLYEEIKPGMIELMKPKHTFQQSEIQDGDIICFQVEMKEQECVSWSVASVATCANMTRQDSRSRGAGPVLEPDPVLRLYAEPGHDPLPSQVRGSQRRAQGAAGRAEQKAHLRHCAHLHFTLVGVRLLSMRAAQMASKVAEQLAWDPIKLRFTTTHSANGSPKSVLKRSLNQSVAEIISPAYSSPAATVVLYEKLDVSIVELETKRSLKVIWTGVHNKEETTHPYLLPKTAMVHDLAEHLVKDATMSQGGSGKIRVFEVSKDGKTQKEFTGSEMIGNIPDPVELFAEVRRAHTCPLSARDAC